MYSKGQYYHKELSVSHLSLCRIEDFEHCPEIQTSCVHLKEYCRCTVVNSIGFLHILYSYVRVCTVYWDIYYIHCIILYSVVYMVPTYSVFLCRYGIMGCIIYVHCIFLYFLYFKIILKLLNIGLNYSYCIKY